VTAHEHDRPETLRQRVHDAEPGCWVTLVRKLAAGQGLRDLDM
jgi:folate-dependent phosphoribosylglycinamide formyltransferase PurN